MPLYRWEIIGRRKPLITPKLHDVSQVLYLPFDLDDGSYARDRSGYSNHGTIYGATRVAGKIGGALDFDGVDDYVEAPDSASLRLDNFTVEAWAYPTEVRDEGVVRRGYSGHINYLLRITSGKEVLAYVQTDIGSYGVRSTELVVLNNWNHLVAVYDGSAIHVYVNTVEKSAPATGTPIQVVGETLNIGVERISDVTLSRYFKGVIDEVRIYNRGLSQSEIKRLMNLRGV